MLELGFDNARLAITRNAELAGDSRLSIADWEIHLLGRPDWLVEYEALDYRRDRRDIDRALERALADLLSDAGSVDGLARLSGRFLILAARGGRLELAATSDEFPNRVYFYQEADRLVIDDDWRRFVNRDRALDISQYSLEDLGYLDRKKTCRPGRTLFRGLGRLQPATLYRLDDRRLRRERAVYYRKKDSRRLTHRDFLDAVGRRLPPGPFTLAYSTGIDSHHLLNTLGDRVQDVCTAYLAPPFQDAERTKEAAAAVVNAVEAGKKLHLIAADFGDLDNYKYLRHAVDRDPFACHYAFSVYRMFRAGETDCLVTGQNADTVQWFGLTSELSPWKLLARSPHKNYDREWQRAYYRWCAARSHGRLVNPKLLDRRLFYGRLAEVERLTGPDGYWPFLYFKMINNMTSGNTASFRNAAAYFNKRVCFPYIEPLALYVSAYLRRTFGSLFQPKRNLRRLYNYFQHDQIAWPVAAGLPLEQSPLFRESARRMRDISPGFKQELDSRAKGAVARTFLYEIVRRSAGDLP